MTRTRVYQLLCGAMGALMMIVGVGFVWAFFRYHMPEAPAALLLPVGPNGAYFMAFTGCALAAWGGCLLGSARHPGTAPWIGSATAFGLTLAAIYRIFAWLIGDYAALGGLLRVEAAIFLLLALAFVWLRPRTTGPSPAIAR